jgi:hypothetical protein
MSISRQEILDLKEYYISTLYGQARQEQAIDQLFYEDTFDVPMIKDKSKILRSGLARRIIDTPAEQLISSNPQVFVNSGEKEADIRLSKLLNYWVQILRRQNPNPFKENIKNPLLRGETYIYLCHNEYAVSNDYDGKTMPIDFLIPDPATIYASEEEDENGCPLRVIVSFTRRVTDIQRYYPKWEPPTRDKLVDWVAYFDKDVKYCEAGGIPVLEGKNSDSDGIVENPFKSVPFIRRFSGFGRRDADKELESLIVSEIRGSRGLLMEECLTRSDVASALHLYSNPRVTIVIPDTSDGVDASTFKKQYSLEAGSVSVLPLPAGSTFPEQNQLKPVPEMFAHLAEVNARILHRHPMAGAGATATNSGRQDDLMGQTMMHRYQSIVENVESMFAVAFEKSLEICEELGIELEGIKTSDLEREIDITVKLRAEDPLERDRLITLGDRLYNGGNGSIDIETYHTEFLGYTQEKSRQVQAKMLADKVTLYNPDVAQVMGMVFAEESGLGDWLDKAKQATAQTQTQQRALPSQPPPTQGARPPEILTEQGFEMMDMSASQKGARRPPTNYQRGQ